VDARASFALLLGLPRRAFELQHALLGLPVDGCLRPHALRLLNFTSPFQTGSAQSWKFPIVATRVNPMSVNHTSLGLVLFSDLTILIHPTLKQYQN
jgi:hypothetical protein